MTESGKHDSIGITVAVLAVLMCVGGWTLWKLLTKKEFTTQLPTLPSRTRIVARRELEAFTLLKDSDLEMRAGSTEFAAEALSPKAPTVSEVKDRYLLVKVKRGGEIKSEMVAPSEATGLLADAVAVGIASSSTTSVGGQLQIGDVVDVLAAPAKNDPATPSQSSGLRKFENLLVLSIVAGSAAKSSEKDVVGIPGAISLALPRSERDNFAAAIVSGPLVVTRKIIAAH